MKIKYYISLDLGSESTAAYYENVETGEGDMIDLQAYAKDLLGDFPPDLYEDDDQKPSPRLRTLFYLEDNKQPDRLPDLHAELDFIGPDGKKLAYEDSLFKYFLRVNQDLASVKVMPNPKIPFQEGASKIIPSVKSSTGEDVQYEPLQLIQHMTTQIVRNFVLKSKPLKMSTPDEVCLILTVPNVYSLTHVEKIREFVQLHTNIAQVESLYESDAVAYCTLDDVKGTDPNDIKEFKNKLLKRKNKEELRIVTIDVGRGTTDLSLIKIKTAGEASDISDRQPHFVLARTGKSDGGNQLSYLLAKYYNDKLKETFRNYGHLIDRSLSFNFLEGKTPMELDQPPVLKKLQLLIEKMKRSITGEYKISLSKEEQMVLINPLIDQIFTTFLPDKTKWEKDEKYEAMREKLQKAFYLPNMPGKFKIWWHKNIKKSKQIDELIKLKGELQDYVEQNILILLEQLEIMAAARENKPSEKYIFNKKSTFVVVAGQASQFEPIKQAIYHAFDKLNLPSENIHFLTGAAAKEACCRGAISYKRSFNQPMNTEELHGTYGFLSANIFDKNDRFKPIDMRKLNNEGEDSVDFKFLNHYFLIYSPRHGLSSENPPVRFDGSTAVIKGFPEERIFQVKYLKEKAQLEVNGKDVIPVATFGLINQKIYPKVWPELVEPINGKRG